MVHEATSFLYSLNHAELWDVTSFWSTETSKEQFVAAPKGTPTEILVVVMPGLVDWVYKVIWLVVVPK